MFSDMYKTLAVNLGLLVLVVVVRKVVHRAGIGSFLIDFEERTWPLFAEGLFAGAVYVLAYSALVLVTGAGRLVADASRIMPTLRFLVVPALAHLVLALFEEALFRGYILQKLKGRLPVPASVLLTSVTFIPFHLALSGGHGLSLLTVANSLLLQAILCIMVLNSNSIVPGIGKHLSWGLGLSLLFSREHLGVTSAVNLTIVENLLSGRAGSPESGAAMTVVLVAGMAFELHHYRHVRAG